jgi:putative flavoprotein involved in K+ transport
MANKKVDTLVVGGGQAGLAMSEHLSSYGVPHLVLERHRIAERWRSERWDSLVANGPAWHDRFPGLEFSDIDPDAFAPKEMVADYLVAYAEKIAAPIRCGVEVTEVRKNEGRPGFRVETSDGVIEADEVVVATGPFQCPVIPAVVPDGAGVTQIHSSAYRNPGQLLEGAVLVIGAGSRAYRSRMSSWVPGGASTSRSARTTVLPEAIAGVTSSGGWGSSASGIPQPSSRAWNTSRSR